MAYNNNISILWIMDMPDQILELSSQVTQPIKDALGEAFCKILDFLREIKEKVTSLPSVFCSSAQCTEVRFASFRSVGFITAIVINPLL